MCPTLDLLFRFDKINVQSFSWSNAGFLLRGRGTEEGKEVPSSQALAFLLKDFCPHYSW